MPSPHDLCSFGDYCWDVIVRTPDDLPRGGDALGTVELHPGGSAANTAVWAARCGASVSFIGMVGDDWLGTLAAQDLAAEGVQACLPTSTQRPTGAVASFVDASGERSMVTGVGADHLILPGEVDVELVAAARHVHLTGWSLFGDPPRAAALAVAAAAHDHGRTVSLDPSAHVLIEEMGVARFLELTDRLRPAIVFPNRDEGRVLTGEREPERIASALSERLSHALVVLKLDADGALVWIDGTATHVPGLAVTPVDTTGAGDSFAGAFLARWLRGDDPVTATVEAVRVSAFVVAHHGARPAVTNGVRPRS